MADDRDPVDRRDVDGGAGRVLADVARRSEVAVAAVQRADRRLEAARGEELERREHAAVDVARLDVAAAAGVDPDVRAVEYAPLQRLLAHQQDLADRRVLGVGAEERVLARGAVDRGRLEQLPAVEDRLRGDPPRALAPGADLQAHVRRLGLRHAAEAAEDRAGDDARADLERLELDLVALEPEDLREVVLEGADAGDVRALVEQLLAPAGLERGGAARVGEDALLGHRDLGLRLDDRLRRDRVDDLRALAAGGGRLRRLRVGLGQVELLGDLLVADPLRPGRRVVLR